MLIFKEIKRNLIFKWFEKVSWFCYHVFNSKFFISGDLEQFDRHKDKTQTGLWDALNKFQNMNDIGVFEFKSNDIVRNPLISKILEKYEE